MRWTVRLGTALAVALTSLLSPAAAAQASVRTPGATVGPTVYSTSSPRCHFSLDTWPSTKGNEVTALHVTGAWLCPGVNDGTFGSIDLEDTTVAPQWKSTSWPAGESAAGFSAASGSLAVDYAHPKTGHVYQATLEIDFEQLDPSWQSEGGCSANGGSAQNYVCVFQQQYVVQSAPPVGPTAAPAPVHQSRTLTTADGRSCDIQLDLTDSGPGQFSFAGSVPPATCNILGPPTARPPQLAMINEAEAFAYTDQREPGQPVASGNPQCWYCSNTSSSSGVLPAVTQYTVTYYVDIDLGDLALTSIPEGCTPQAFNWIYCELSASVT